MILDPPEPNSLVIYSIVHERSSISPEAADERRRNLSRLVSRRPPTTPRAQCIFTVLTPPGLPAGKVTAAQFLPRFLYALRASGYDTHFACSLPQLDCLLKSKVPSIVVHLYGEDRFEIATSAVRDLEDRALAVFNRAQTGRVLANKRETLRVLGDAGVLTPEQDPHNGAGFERHNTGTGLPSRYLAEVSNREESTSTDKILTRFVDTRVSLAGRDYYTTVRLLCVDGTVLHAYPRARPALEGSENVHGRNMPRNPRLIEQLDQTLVQPFEDEFRSLAVSVFNVLGHGFYSHDVLIERNTNALYVCESGFKFDDMTYAAHLAPIKTHLPSQSVLFPLEAFAEVSVRAFLASCDRLLTTA